MKKFLCYDTNDVANGKIDVDSRGVLKPNSTVPSGGEPYQQLVIDETGNVKWKNPPAYYVTIGCDSVHKPSTCDTPYETIFGLLDDGFPVVAFLVDHRNCFTSSGVFFDVNNHCIQFDFIGLTGPNEIGQHSVCYNSDGELYDPSMVS